MNIEKDRCKGAAYCEKDELKDKMLQMVNIMDCRTCRYYGVDCCLHMAQCLNADRYEQILPIQMWKTK